jgi:hypothetical protein
MTPQERMAAKLAEIGIPSKEIKCYGSQIVITCHSQAAAHKWVPILGKFSKVRGITRGLDYAKENTRSVMNPSTVEAPSLPSVSLASVRDPKTKVATSSVLSDPVASPDYDSTDYANDLGITIASLRYWLDVYEADDDPDAKKHAREFVALRSDEFRKKSGIQLYGKQ